MPRRLRAGTFTINRIAIIIGVVIGAIICIAIAIIGTSS